MKQFLVQYVAYNLWANEQILNTLLEQPPVVLHENIPSSFPTLFKTVLHMWDAESIWWQRVQGAVSLEIPSKVFTGDEIALVNGLKEQDRQWLTWVQALPDEGTQKMIRYKNLKGHGFEDPIYVILSHVCNHGTYHRGQLVTMLRSLGVDKIPQTDFIYWNRLVAG